MARRLPAKVCAVCGCSIEETQGARLIAARDLGISLCGASTPLAELRHPVRTQPLTDKYRGVILAITGALLWREDIMARIRQAAQNGERPWFCQRCAGTGLCTECGDPLNRAAGCDYVDDEGRILHSPVLAGPACRCANPVCHASSGS